MTLIAYRPVRANAPRADSRSGQFSNLDLTFFHDHVVDPPGNSIHSGDMGAYSCCSWVKFET